MDAEARYHAHYTPPTMDGGTAYMLKISPYGRSKEILSAADLESAIHGCDTYVRTKVLTGNLALGYVYTLM